jgi:hypothetical protein
MSGAPPTRPPRRIKDEAWLVKAVNSTLNGNKLEDSFYEYLLAQQERGELVFEDYPV